LDISIIKVYNVANEIEETIIEVACHRLHFKA